MNTKFYEAVIDENSLVKLSPPASDGGDIKTGKLGSPLWGVFWPRPRAEKLEISKVERRNNPEKDGEYKMHIKYFTNVAGMNGGKLFFDDEETGEKWRKLLKALGAAGEDRKISEAMRKIGFPDLLVKIDENAPTLIGRMPTVFYPETDRIHLCSVDSSNRCILYTRDRLNNYLQFTELTELRVFDEPLAEGAQTEPMVAESETGGTGNRLHEMDSRSSTEQDTGGRESKRRGKGSLSCCGAQAGGHQRGYHRMAGGKKTKKRKRKTNKRKGRKRSTKNLKSKRKNKKYTKRRR